jgi:hypothetical protein
MQKYKCIMESNKISFRMNGHRCDFNLHKAGKSNKMDNKLLYEHRSLGVQVISNEDLNLQQFKFEEAALIPE